MATKPSPLIHFELPENTTGNYKAKCKYCSSCISASNKSSSNFTTHLKVRKASCPIVIVYMSFLLQRKHPKIYEEAQKSGTKAKVTGEQTTVDSFIPGRKYAPNDSRQCRALDALICLVADNMLPLSIVESPSFRKYCLSLDPRFVVPSRKHLYYFIGKKT